MGGSKAIRVGVGRLESDELSFVWVDAEAIPHKPVSDAKEAICTFVSNSSMTRTCGKDCAIIHISGEGAELPILGNAEQWEDVYGRQNGRHGGPLWGAVV